MTETHLHFPFPPQCSSYPGGIYGSRCRNTATGWLYGPDGRPNPGGYICQAHADACIAEYHEKLGETWTVRPLVVGDGR